MVMDISGIAAVGSYASVIICGLIKPEDKKYNPSAIAENYWKLYTQKKEDFEVELLY